MKRLCVILALTLLSGCGLGRWISGGHSNLAPPAKLTHFPAKLTIHTVWSHTVGNGTGGYYLDLKPALYHNVIYVASENGHVASFAAATGKKLWERNIHHHITAGVGAGHGLIVVGTRRGHVVALQAVSGATLWVSQASSEVLAAPTIGPQAVYVATLDGRLTAFSQGHGRRLWMVGHSQASLKLFMTAQPRWYHGALYEGYANGEVVAFNPAQGNRLWTSPIAEPRGGDAVERLVDVGRLTMAQGVIYAASYHGNVVALTAQKGGILWSHPLSSYRSLALGQQTLYVVSAHSRVVALAAASGGTIWDQKVLLNRHLGSPALVGPAVVMGDFAGYVQWLNRQTGALMARKRVGEGAIRAAPLVSRVGGHHGLPFVFVLSTTGKIAALRFHPKPS